MKNELYKTLVATIIALLLLIATCYSVVIYSNHQKQIRAQVIENKRLETIHEKELENQVIQLQNVITNLTKQSEKQTVTITNLQNELVQDHKVAEEVISNYSNHLASVIAQKAQEPIMIQIVPDGQQEIREKYRHNPYRRIGGMY